MNINIHTGLLEEARKIMSPNADDRPPNAKPELVVIHNISLPPNEFGTPWVNDFFLNKLDPKVHPYFEQIHQMRVSTHLYIRRTGEIIQYVPFTKRAWHAGKSCYGHRENCNDFSIGIELEGADHIPYEEAQYSALVDVITTLCTHYPELDTTSVVGHSDIAPGRKTDPGPAFDWIYFRKRLNRDRIGSSGTIDYV